MGMENFIERWHGHGYEESHRLKFFIDENAVGIKKELEISLRAGEIVGNLYDAFSKSYVDPTTPDARASLNKLCVRLGFCLYAEDAGIFPKNLFTSYLNSFTTARLRRALLDLFEVLNTSEASRDPYLVPELRAFPYVDGKLFEEDRIEIPNFNDESRYCLLTEAADFNWSGISPTIFGALFESTLNPITRRADGMHYTSIENIHKVIDPLFLDKLRAELDRCKNRRQLLALQTKIGTLKFFDPACGSGNFLAETYLSLRRLENEIIKKLLGAEIKPGELDNPIKVTIENFCGIEINDFACAVAQTAMWIAESQMMIETQQIIHRELDLLPLRSTAHIVKGNALTLDWHEIIPRGVDYIIGNPPFVGASMMSTEQKAEAVAIFGKGKLVNSIDYVGAWFHKAAALMQGTEIRAAFVSTNSIAQGEQVAPLWRKLLDEYKVHIDFAHKTFKWYNELHSASVHCVVVGFSVAPNDQPKIIFDGDKKIIAENINPYLVDAPDILIESRAKPLNPNIPMMTKGNQPSDGGNLILSVEERSQLLKSNPQLAVCIRRYVGARDFLHNDEVRYCLWLRDAEPYVYRKSRTIMKRLDAVRKFRLNSTSKQTRDMAERPTLFFSAPQIEGVDLIVIPRVSSERRKYVPMGFVEPSIVAADSVQIIQGAGLYEFGVLNSSMHMAWMRRVCGRLGTGYRYSAGIVYNNFVWCNPTEAKRQTIIRTAENILTVRAQHPKNALADLYDPKTMPNDLRRAHDENDRAVLAAYGFDKNATEEEIVGRLMIMYQQLTGG